MTNGTREKADIPTEEDVEGLVKLCEFKRVGKLGKGAAERIWEFRNKLKEDSPREGGAVHIAIVYTNGERYGIFQKDGCQYVISDGKAALRMEEAYSKRVILEKRTRVKNPRTGVLETAESPNLNEYPNFESRSSYGKGDPEISRFADTLPRKPELTFLYT